MSIYQQLPDGSIVPLKIEQSIQEIVQTTLAEPISCMKDALNTLESTTINIGESNDS